MDTMMFKSGAVVILLAVVGAVVAQDQLETPRLSQRDQRRLFPLVGGVSSFEMTFKDAAGSSRVDNAAVLQLQMDKVANPFLATLTYPGAAQFLTVLKPCGMILPHVHQRATEIYSIMSGVMSAGIAQENGGLQNITFNVGVGEAFIVPQGLVHFNHNNRCTPNAFFQSFNSADPGAINIINALAALRLSGSAGAAAIAASGASSIVASAQGAFGLDQACLSRCGFPATGAPNGGLGTLPTNIKHMFGV